MTEKIEEIVTLQTEAIKNIKIDKVTVWDSGSGDGGSSTSNFMSNLIKSLPPLHEVAGMAGWNCRIIWATSKARNQPQKRQPPRPRRSRE